MHRLTLPIVLGHRGEVVKYDADNLLAVFDEPRRAVEAAIAMHQATAASAKEGMALAFSIGIDYGEILMIGEADCFGNAVNLAYKLGEDVAQPGEVLISPAVRERLRAGPLHSAKRNRAKRFGRRIEGLHRNLRSTHVRRWDSLNSFEPGFRIRSGRHGSRTHIPFRGARISSAARQTISGYLP